MSVSSPNGHLFERLESLGQIYEFPGYGQCHRLPCHSPGMHTISRKRLFVLAENYLLVNKLFMQLNLKIPENNVHCLND